MLISYSPSPPLVLQWQIKSDTLHNYSLSSLMSVAFNHHVPFSTFTSYSQFWTLCTLPDSLWTAAWSSPLVVQHTSPSWTTCWGELSSWGCNVIDTVILELWLVWSKQQWLRERTANWNTSFAHYQIYTLRSSNHLLVSFHYKIFTSSTWTLTRCIYWPLVSSYKDFWQLPAHTHNSWPSIPREA